MDNCIFCKIIKGEMPSYKIYEDDNYLAFLDLTQFTRGHTLIIPKIHCQRIWDIDDFQGFMNVVYKIGKHYRKLGYKYVDSLSFGRMISHAHMHLVPHNGDDPDWERGLAGLEYFHSDDRPQKSAEDFRKIITEFKLT